MASFIKTTVLAKLALARESMAEASEAGLVRESSCRARFVKRSQHLRAPSVLVSILAMAAANSSVLRVTTMLRRDCLLKNSSALVFQQECARSVSVGGSLFKACAEYNR